MENCQVNSYKLFQNEKYRYVYMKHYFNFVTADFNIFTQPFSFLNYSSLAQTITLQKRKGIEDMTNKKCMRIKNYFLLFQFQFSNKNMIT